MCGPGCEEFGPGLTAAIKHLVAARVERAAQRRVERVGHFALHRRAGAAGVVHLRDRVQQHLGVRVLRVAKQGVFVAYSSNPAVAEQIAALRSQGERVVQGFDRQQVDYNELNCDRALVEQDGSWVIQKLS